MCGIAGLLRYNSKPSYEEVKKMCAAIAHRGPDGEGIEIVENIGLGHRRLSIIDLETGAQPMYVNNKKLWITFNGEIYNFKELKEELRCLGYEFRTKSDTEVVLNSYLEWGSSCVNKFRGMFAFCIADLNKKTLFLARDQFGIKPLVYRNGQGFFAFASELNALKAIEPETLVGDKKAVLEYLKLQYIPAPRTIYKNVYKLPPAHYLILDFEGNTIEKKRYWNLKFIPDNKLSLIEWEEEFKLYFRDSVKAHLVSDVPFGVFLSGGIDSTLVALEMSELLNHPVKAFNISFAEKDFNEYEYAKIVADNAGVELISKKVGGGFIELLDDLINNHYGEPYSDSSAIPTWYLSKLARSHVPMVLSGDGGDETFGGYNSYMWWMSKNYREILRRKITQNQYLGIPRYCLGTYKKYLINNRSLNFVEEWGEIMGFISPYIMPFLNEGLIQEYSKSIKLFNDIHVDCVKFDRLSYAQYMDINSYMVYDILTKVDIASMAHGLEVRPPLIDVKMANLFSKLPQNAKVGNFNNQIEMKYLLKKIVSKKFNGNFAFRKKKGFAIPKDEWLLGDTKNIDQIKSLLFNNSGLLNHFFNVDKMKKLFSSDYEYKGTILYMVVVLELWLKNNSNMNFE